MSPYRLSRIFVAIMQIAAFPALLHVATVGARAVRVDIQTQVSPRAGSGVAKITEQWAKEWTAKNVDGLIALYAEEAVFLTATGSRVTGRPAIRELFEKALAVYTSDIRVQSKVAEQSGNLAYDSGEYEEISTLRGVKRSGRGNYLVVFRRDGKNQWRIVQHMWADVPTKGQ